MHSELNTLVLTSLVHTTQIKKEYVLQALAWNLLTGLALLFFYDTQRLCNAPGKEQTLNYANSYVLFSTLSHPQFFTCYFLLQTLLLTYLRTHFPPITYLLTFIPHTSLPLSPFISESSVLVCKSLYCFSFMPRAPFLFLSCPLECTPVLYSNRYVFHLFFS